MKEEENPVSNPSAPSPLPVPNAGFQWTAELEAELPIVRGQRK